MDKGDFVSSEELIGFVKSEFETIGNKKVCLMGSQEIKKTSMNGINR